MTKKKLAGFRPQRNNVNRHKPNAMALLDKSIRGDGWMGAITTAADGEVFAGSARLETAAEVMGESEPIIVETDGTRPIIVRRTDIPNADDPRAKRLGVADNSIAAASWNPDGDLLAMLAADDEAIAAMVRNDDTAARAVMEAANKAGEGDAEPQIDRAEELREKWQTERGQLWAIGEHRLLCGDSTAREDVERVMGGEKADMLLLDPPYGMRLDADFSGMKNNLAFAQEKGVKSGKKYDNVIGDHSDFDASKVARFFDNVKEQFWFGADYYSATLGDTMHSGAWLVWDKRLDDSADKMYGSCFELVWSKQKHKRDILRHKWAGIFGTEHEPQRGRTHPNQKPMPLYAEMLNTYSSANAIVFDGFAGSGTTLVACQNLNRKARAIEISPAYCAVILERMAQAFPGIEIKQI